jgi:DNA polymerase/3'-5' exonuclease PolX
MNHLIITQFAKLIEQAKLELLHAQAEGNPKEIKSSKFRLEALKKSLNIIKGLQFEITKGSDLLGIPGIGEGTRDRIDKILVKGKLEELENKFTGEKKQKIEDLQGLMEIIGVGEALARKLVNDYGIHSVAELKAAGKAGKIKIGPKLALGLKYVGKIETKIKRQQITTIQDKYLALAVKEVDSDLGFTICGSYRRGKSYQGDVDVLIYHPDVVTEQDVKTIDQNLSYLRQLTDLLYHKGYIVDHITDKNFKASYMGVCKFPRMSLMRLDIKFIPYGTLPTALLHFTGPQALNVYMREQAKKRSWKLSEKGLFEVDEMDHIVSRIKVDSEKDVFTRLGMKYLTPEQREGFSLN